MADVSLCCRPVCGPAEPDGKSSHKIRFPLELFRNAVYLKQLPHSTQKSLHFNEKRARPLPAGACDWPLSPTLKQPSVEQFQFVSEVLGMMIAPYDSLTSS